MDKGIVREIKRLRKKGWPMINALRVAKIRARFAELEAEGLVRLTIEPDCEPYDDTYIDTWDDLTPAQRKAEKKKLWDRIEREGVWGVVGKYRVGDRWHTGGSCWGFIGEDYEDDTDTDIMAETIAMLADRGVKQYEGHATFGG